MKKHSTVAATLLCTASVLAYSAAFAQSANNANQPVEAVTVTGSLIVSTSVNAPTPVTVVNTDQIQTTTPDNLQNALAKLPAFLGSANQRSSATSTQGGQGNQISLRNLGITRTLILFDGKRVAPSDAQGTVNIDGLPQMLVQRVDVVTGGASATYGSDAVAGVVNFILDKKFTGFKYEAHGGISGFADAAEESIGFAAGTNLFGGRGHLEGDVRYFRQDPVNLSARPYGANGQAWAMTGNGSAAKPFTNTPYARLVNQAENGGVVNCSGCAANWTTFTPAGDLIPFQQGTPTGTPGTNMGGDGGGYYNTSSFQSELRQAETFLRFSYQLNDSIDFYIQGNWNESYNINHASATTINPGPGRGSIIPVTQAYLQPATRTALTTGNTQISPTLGVPLFTYGVFFDTVGGVPVVQSGDDFRSLNLDRNLSFTTGLDGTLLDKYDWSVFFTYNENRLEGAVPHNDNVQKFLAGEDAVVAPAGTVINGVNMAGQIVCQVSLTQFSNLYPGCVPINPFGKGAMTQQMFNYYSDRTQYEATNALLDAGGTISGEVFALPAGPISAGFSAEIRRQSLNIQSAFNPANTMDCTGLRLCTPGVAALYDQVTTAPLPTTAITVWELAGELDIPVLKDLPLIQSFNINIAGRHTDYSSSGPADTWKIGADDRIDDNFRLRATMSVDIRAPNLYELHQPLSVATAPYADLLTGGNFSIRRDTIGNPSLTPEVAHTYTAGLVFTPTFAPGLSATLDYYKINMSNAISSISGSTVGIQQICLASGGTSPYCALTVRPFPLTNTTLANYPTSFKVQSLNSAKVRTEGLDLDIDYHFDMEDVLPDLPGDVHIRNILGIQPYLSNVGFPGSAAQLTPMPKGRNVTMLNYRIGSWGINVQNNYFGGFSRLTAAGQVFVQPHVPHFDTVDISVSKDFTIGDMPTNLLFSVQNVVDTQPPLQPTAQTNPGLSYPVPVGESGMGRYFIIGLKGNL
ncbi:MAG TPA: TonB-dependent receptor [Rhizomicrobium sp.]|nr:TonB-dependent receptor [Rhizomicrobium sp.]